MNRLEPEQSVASLDVEQSEATSRDPERHGGVELIERRPMPPLGHFSLVRFRKLAVESRFASAMARAARG